MVEDDTDDDHELSGNTDGVNSINQHPGDMMKMSHTNVHFQKAADAINASQHSGDLVDVKHSNKHSRNADDVVNKNSRNADGVVYQHLHVADANTVSVRSDYMAGGDVDNLPHNSANNIYQHADDVVDMNYVNEHLCSAVDENDQNDHLIEHREAVVEAIITPVVIQQTEFTVDLDMLTDVEVDVTDSLILELQQKIQKSKKKSELTDLKVQQLEKHLSLKDSLILKQQEEIRKSL